MDDGERTAHRAIDVYVLAAIRLYRDGLAHFLREHTLFNVAGATGNVEEGLSAIRALQPDVVLLDRLFDDGVSVVCKILERAARVRVIALAVSELETDILPYAQAGVSGYVMHDDSLEELARKIQAAVRGEVLCSPQTSGMLLRGLHRGRQVEQSARSRRLTKREVEIISLLEEGLSNKEIASRLYIEVATVKNHLHNVYEKLGVSRRDRAVAWLDAERRIETLQLPPIEPAAAR